MSTPAAPAVVGKLSTLDRFLPVWIGVAMPVGPVLGRGVPGLGTALQAVQIDGISLPIFPGKCCEHWDVADPNGQPIEVVGAIRDEIQARVTTLLGQVLHHS